MRGETEAVEVFRPQHSGGRGLFEPAAVTTAAAADGQTISPYLHPTGYSMALIASRPRQH